ncbi:hypothetical protein HZC34_01850 [Candidatus Saganbacteria bacterium]|nr:hypothetical protein [Candidatus Saganbacteria bacterium]
MAKKTKKSQKSILNEIKTQLILQAERWGRKDYYTQDKLEEMELDQCRKIKGDLLSEKNNIEYELNMLDTDKKEVLIKLERLEAYLKRADKVIKKHEKTITKLYEKKIGDTEMIKKAARGYNVKPKISVMVGN